MYMIYHRYMYVYIYIYIHIYGIIMYYICIMCSMVACF